MRAIDHARPANRVDDKILALAATHSPQEISVALGGIISAEAVAAHTQTLLRSKDWLTAAQEDQLITIRMNNMLLEFEDRFLDEESGTLRLKILKELGARLDKRRTATEIDLNTWSANTGRAMAQVYDNALSYMKGALRTIIDPEEWDKAALEALNHAQLELAKREAIEE